MLADGQTLRSRSRHAAVRTEYRPPGLFYLVGTSLQTHQTLTKLTIDPGSTLASPWPWSLPALTLALASPEY